MNLAPAYGGLRRTYHGRLHSLRLRKLRTLTNKRYRSVECRAAAIDGFEHLAPQADGRGIAAVGANVLVAVEKRFGNVSTAQAEIE